MKAIFFLTSEALREAIADYLRKKEGRDFDIDKIDPPLQDDDLIKVEVTRREAPKPPATVTSVGSTIIAEVQKNLPENPVAIKPPPDKADSSP